MTYESPDSVSTSGMILALYRTGGPRRMGTSRTETTHVSAKGFDLRSPYDALDILATAQLGAAWSVRSALKAIALASEMTAAIIEQGGSLALAAAGSSALMELYDALDLHGT